MLARDHYAALGVSPSAEHEEIEQAYRHLSRRYHPDINPGDVRTAAVYERIQKAYEVLSDPARRARYDGGHAARSLPRGHDLSVRLVPDAEAGGSYRELFRQLRDQSLRRGGTRGDDIHITVNVPLVQAERGRRVGIETFRRRPCPSCGGRGRVRLQQRQPCGRCEGSGREQFAKGSLSISCPCSECDGDGALAGIVCETCRGTGLQGSRDRLLVRVPAGSLHGQEIRMPRAGHHGPRGGEPGDLIVRVQVEPVAGFEREGPHLRTVVPVGIDEAVLGARIELVTLQGEPATLRLPPLTQNGRVFRLRGRGLEMPDGRRGDMLVRVEIRIPDMVDEDSKDLIRRFGARNPSASQLRESAARSQS